MEKIDEYWDRIHLQYNSTYDEWLNKYVPLFNKDSRVIELGCGRAYCSKYLLENGFKNIVACDISKEVLKIVNNVTPELKTLLFDMSKGLPFDNGSIDVIIADLSLHYFNSTTTDFIFDEIYRVLSDNGLLIARVNATNDMLHIPENSKEIEKNFYYDGEIYKKFFDCDDFIRLFNGFNILSLEQKNMSRYEKTKMLWEFCIKKSSVKRGIKDDKRGVTI